MADGSWSVADAKARFSEVVEKARAEGPQFVTKNGKQAVVIVSSEEWKQLRRPLLSVADVLLHPTVRGVLTEDEAKLFEREENLGRPPPRF